MGRIRPAGRIPGTPALRASLSLCFAKTDQIRTTCPHLCLVFTSHSQNKSWYCHDCSLWSSFKCESGSLQNEEREETVELNLNIGPPPSFLIGLVHWLTAQLRWILLVDQTLGPWVCDKLLRLLKKSHYYRLPILHQTTGLH